jgi:RNA polymerase-binding transcription factor DksA
MSKGYGDADGHVLAEAFHVQDSLAMHALRKLANDNETGICKSCEFPIPEARLKVVPNAKYCVQCQASHDKRPLTFACRNVYVP